MENKPNKPAAGKSFKAIITSAQNKRLEAAEPKSGSGITKRASEIKDTAVHIWQDGVGMAIIVGMLGLILGVYLFTGDDNAYGEIGIKKRAMIDTLLTDRMQCLIQTKSGISKQLAVALAKAPKTPKKKTKDTTTKPSTDSINSYRKQLQSIDKILRSTRREKLALDSGNADTSLLYFSKYVLVKRKDFSDGIDAGDWKQSEVNGKKPSKKEISIPAVLVDTCKSCAVYPIVKAMPLVMTQNKREKAIDFFKEYPQFGLWIVFSIAQMVLWFILLPLLVGNVQNLNHKIGADNYKITLVQILSNTILPLLVIVVFCYLFYVKMLNKKIITDDYFFDNFSHTSVFYAVIGYAIATICFGTFISLTHKLDKINSDTKNKITRADSPELNAAYMALKAAFDNSFLFSALILSFVVLWTGIMINAVNSTEAFRFYYLISGKYFIPNDFIYLLGLMHTLILLIFYVPAKMKFNNLTITQLTPTTNNGETPSAGLFSTLSSSLGPLLVTVSPLLAGLIHSILNLITKN